MEPLDLEADKAASQAFRERISLLREKPAVYESSFSSSEIPLSLTFNDVLMVPQYSEIDSRSDCCIESKFSRNVPLNIPIVSSPMDTVTEYSMAVEMAKQGGLGIVHRFLSVEEQANMVEKVKRSGAFINTDPVLIDRTANLPKVREMTGKYGISSFLVVHRDANQTPRLGNADSFRIEGILTKRDIGCMEFEDELVENFMTPVEKLVYLEVSKNYPESYSMEGILKESKQILLRNKVEKIPVLFPDKTILGLICLKDIHSYEKNKKANKDHEGRLRVGAAIGCNKDYLERAELLRRAGVDVLVLDVANAHNKLAINATETIKESFPTLDLVAGSVATGEGAENLIRSGADGIRCGIGNGSICITRIKAGCGVPQLMALKDTSPVCSFYDVPLCSDGGNKNSGNMCKALAMGADSVMIGRLIAGCTESPGESFNKDGKFVKVYRGMAGLGANISRKERTGEENLNIQTFSAEGVEGYTPFTGPAEFVLKGFTDGIKSGMSYNGAGNLKALKKNVKFVQMTGSGGKESNVHGVEMFK